MEIKINIKKKDLFLISAIVVFLVGVGVVMSYNAVGTGGTPSIMGHSVDEIAGISNYYTKGEAYSRLEIDTKINGINTAINSKVDYASAADNYGGEHGGLYGYCSINSQTKQCTSILSNIATCKKGVCGCHNPEYFISVYLGPNIWSCLRK